MLFDGHPQIVQGLDGPLQARKSLGRGPKVKIFSPFRPTSARAIGHELTELPGHILSGAAGIIGDGTLACRAGPGCREALSMPQ